MPNTTCCTLFFLFLLPGLGTRAQPSRRDSLISDSAYALALAQYHAYAAPETGLFRGPQYVDYDFTIQKGQPFFGPDSMRFGSIWYNGIFYDHLLLLYDLVREQLVINDPYKVYKISLIMDLVGDFTIENHVFIRLRDSLTPSAPRQGYYEKIYQGHITLLRKEKKTMQENLILTGDNIHLFIESAVSYYLKKEGVYYTVNTKGALLKVMKDRRSEVKKFIRSNNLSWRDNKEQLLLSVTAWYDGLNH